MNVLFLCSARPLPLQAASTRPIFGELQVLVLVLVLLLQNGRDFSARSIGSGFHLNLNDLLFFSASGAAHQIESSCPDQRLSLIHI